MKPVVLGLVAVLAGMVGMADIAAAQRAQPKDKAPPAAAAPAAADPAAAKAALLARIPAMATATKITCTPTDARQIGVFNRVEGEARIATEVLEIACQEGMGYVIGSADNGVVQADDCASQLPAPGAPPSPIACTLPGNANAAAALQPFLTKAGVTCVPEKARGIGKAGANQIYEVACQGGSGFILSAGRGEGATFTAAPCLAAAQTNSKCQLTTEEQNMAVAKTLLEKVTTPCPVTNQRYVFTGSNGDYFEYQCADNTGFMILANRAGQFERQIACKDAIQIGGGCTLTKVDAGSTADNALYTRLAKAAGYNCDVSKYLVFPISGSGREIVEMACSNRPDGAVGIFPSAGKAEVLNCGRAMVEGTNWRCSLTPIESAFGPVTEQLASKGRTTCKVSGLRAIGNNAQWAYLETACADGLPGFVLQYPRGVNAPAEAVTCAAARGIGGGCQLAGNGGAAAAPAPGRGG